jgi:hypothetical protein
MSAAATAINSAIPLAFVDQDCIPYLANDVWVGKELLAGFWRRTALQVENALAGVLSRHSDEAFRRRR